MNPQHQDQFQVIGELLAANTFSSLKPVALLTNFTTYQYYWISHDLAEFRIFTTVFNDSHKAASFARILLSAPQKLTKINIPENLPLSEKRTTIKQIEIIYENDNDDVGNLEEFREEMTSEEQSEFEVTKQFSKIRPHLPPLFRDWYPIKETIINGVPTRIYI